MDKPKHYQNYYIRPLTQAEINQGQIVVKLDPYRIAKVLDINGGAREQIMKKAIRWTTKGDSDRKVIKEIMQACERHLEMLDEDEGNTDPYVKNVDGRTMGRDRSGDMNNGN